MVKLACVYLSGLTKGKKGVRQPSTDKSREAYEEALPARWRRRSREGLFEASPKPVSDIAIHFFGVDVAKSCVCTTVVTYRTRL